MRGRRKGCKIAAADARSTKEAKDGKHSSGRAMIAVKKEVLSVVDVAGGKVERLEENEAGIAQIWVKLQRWIAHLCSHFLALGSLDSKERGVDGSSDVAHKRHACSVADVV